MWVRLSPPREGVGEIPWRQGLSANPDFVGSRGETAQSRPALSVGDHSQIRFLDSEQETLEEEFLGKDVMETSDSGHKTVGWPELWQWRGMRLESAMS